MIWRLETRRFDWFVLSCLVPKQRHRLTTLSRTPSSRNGTSNPLWNQSRRKLDTGCCAFVRLGGIIPNHLSLEQLDNPFRFSTRVAPSPTSFSTILQSFYSRESSQYADNGFTTPSVGVEDRLRGCKDFFHLHLNPLRTKGLNATDPDFPNFTPQRGCGGFIVIRLVSRVP